jgi:predicted HAD superfamily Cof-like phosphohydrolase
VTRLQRAVIEFHQAFDIPIAGAPSVPTDARVRLRARLIAEEFFETLGAIFVELPGHSNLTHLKQDVMGAIDYAAVKVDLVELADGFADLDYVVEGARLEFGINGLPIAKEVHRSNMAKVGGERRADGKLLKPAGWTPPNLLLEITKQQMAPDLHGIEGTLALLAVQKKANVGEG